MSFKAEIASSIRFKKHANFFFSTDQRKWEIFKNYTQRFNRKVIKILGCNEWVAMEAFWKGLMKDSFLFYFLVKNTPETLVQATERVTKYIKVEEDLKRDVRDKGRDSR